MRCYTNFLRAFCSTHQYQFCLSKEMITALDKDCIAGTRFCPGFQKLFDGPIEKECYPWDLDCALLDLLGDDLPVTDRDRYPLLANMPKSSLTIDDAIQLDEFTDLLNDGIWTKGLSSTTEL